MKLEYNLNFGSASNDYFCSRCVSDFIFFNSSTCLTLLFLSRLRLLSISLQNEKKELLKVNNLAPSHPLDGESGLNIDFI